jgi:cobalt/nickel transport system permease protein
MHIAEGILSGPVLAMGALAAAGGIGIGLYRMEVEDVPRVAVISSALFVASLLHLPGPASVHLVLIGLAGVLLGWGAFPAFFVSLLFQSVLFGYGGLSALGVNVTTMGTSAVICSLLFRVLWRGKGIHWAFPAGFAPGSLGVVLGAFLVSLALLATGRSFHLAATAVLAGHLPVALVEGIITGWTVSFLVKVRPEVLRTCGDAAKENSPHDV